MKKTLATLLVVALVASLCGVMFVSAEATNLVAGKTYTISEQYRMGGADVGWGYDPNAPISYPDNNYDLTDGAELVAEYSDACWVGFTPNTPEQKERGYAYINFELDAVSDIDSISYVEYKHKQNGIQPAHTVEVYVSNDGSNYELAATGKLEDDAVNALEDLAYHTFTIDLDASAKYVELRVISYGWAFFGEVEIFGTAAASEPAGDKTYENTLTQKEDGNYMVEVPYGYTWNVNYVDGKIVGEDVTICTTDDAYKACNPNWAITVLLNKQADGTYVAAQDAVVTPGNANAITIGEGQIALVAHSSASNPDAGYANWMGKIVAVAVKAGDVFKIDEAMTTVYAVIPGESDEEPEDKPTTPAEKETIKIDGKLNDDGYDKAVWFADGLWQSNKETDPVIADLDVQYTVRSDDDNIYLTIKVNQGVAFAAALDPNAAFTQVGATDFRLWFLGDGMETRTFYDLLWDGEAFVPFREKVATEELTFAAETGDDYINLEIAIAKSSLKITDSFKLMVTYSTPDCVKPDGTTAYNAFHMTACDEMPSGWSGNADAYETYACADIALGTKAPATGDAGVLVFVVLAVVAVAGVAVASKAKKAL